MPKMTGGRFLAETIQGYGIDHVFLVPVIARRAMVEMGKLGIRRVVTHGEKAAAYMADGYARAANKPGICLAQSVGAANLAAGLQDAWLGLSPVIAITGHRPPMHQHRNSYQEIDHVMPFKSVTKYSVMVESATQLPHVVRQVFREATSGATRPVHIDLQGIQGDEVVEAVAELDVVVEPQFKKRPAFRPTPEPEQTRQAAQILSRARRPVIVAGGGITASEAQRELVELAEMLQIPVATSLNAKGAIPENHPLSVGVVGSYSRWCANRVVSEADLVLFVGSHTGSQVTLDWKIPRPGAAIIQIDIDPSELGRNYPIQSALMGDAKSTLQALKDALEPIGQRTDWTGRAQQLVREWRAEAAPKYNSDAVPIIPQRICNELTAILPGDAILVADTGHAGIWTGSMVELRQPGQSYLRAAGSLGWGFPATLGAKCAAPDRPAICFTGDGGFWYHIGELETAVRYGINAVVVVNNNRALNQNRRGDERAFAKDQTDEDSSVMWQFRDTDFAKVAESMGAWGIRVEKPSEIRSAIEQAIAANRPAVVDIATDPAEAAPLPWSP